MTKQIQERVLTRLLTWRTWSGSGNILFGDELGNHRWFCNDYVDGGNDILRVVQGRYSVVVVMAVLIFRFYLSEGLSTDDLITDFRIGIL